MNNGSANREAVELLPCPFCNRAPVSAWIGNNTPGMDDCGYWSIECRAPECYGIEGANRFAGVHADNEANAASSWNARFAAPAARQPEREPMRHVGDCATDEYASDVCEGMHADKVDKIIGLQAALKEISALCGGHDPHSKQITAVVDRAIKEHGI